jgi:hypothetical protein
VAVQTPASAGQVVSLQDVVGTTTAVRPAESSLIGTIDRFDSAERRLTLKTKDGNKISFVVATDATIRMGPRTLVIQEVAAESGRRAKVRYTTSDGRRTAHWVAISSEPPRQPK